MAEVYTQLGRHREALDLLDSVQLRVSTMSHDLLVGRFYATRAAALAESGRDNEAEQALSPAIQIAERGLASIAGERERFDWKQTFSPSYRSLVQLRFKQDPDSSFRWWEALKGASVRSVTVSSQLPGLLADPEIPEFPGWPSKKIVLLSYATFSNGLALWSFDGTNVRSVWLDAPRSELTLLAQQFAEDCKNRDSDIERVRREAKKLYELLLKPAQKWFVNSFQVIFETDGILDLVPFEALVDDEGRFLSEAYSVSYSPGIFYLAGSRNLGGINGYARALIVGDPRTPKVPGLLPLPDAIDESRDIASLFPESRLLLGRAADLPTILRELPKAELFHFAGHAIASAKVAGLILTESEQNTVDVLTPLQLDRESLRHSRMVVLSACTTVGGPSGTLSDRDSLARSILSDGVPVVVASRWLVDSAATRQWMKVFYQNLIAGRDSADAARQAMTALRSQTQWRHPFYWAAFGVFGLSS